MVVSHSWPVFFICAMLGLPAACASSPQPSVGAGPQASASVSPSPLPSSSAAGAPEPVPSASVSAGPPASAPPKPEPIPEPQKSALPPPIPPNTVVLHIGDSFLQAGFAQALKPRMKELAVRYEIRSEQSSYTTTWAGKMEALVRETKPDLVMINLGANEVSNTDPSTHAQAVRRIVKGIGARPCVWVSPPLWRRDTGIINVIRENSAPCRFFDSDRLVKENIARGSDKIHPTPAGGAVWAGAFWTWLEGERAPLEPSESGLSVGSGEGKRNPWLFKPAPPDEHAAKPYAGPPSPSAGNSG